MTREEYLELHGADETLGECRFCERCGEAIESGEEYFRGFLEFGNTVCVHKGCFKEYVVSETTDETLADMLGFLRYTEGR